jgi:AcrR family transcriptional regulator
VTDRRQDIINAGLAVLMEHGFSGFTQPRVASLAGLRQSHLTYYFPTRLDLLTAVARAAIDSQLSTIDPILDETSIEAAAAMIANVTGRHQNTRVMMALAQAADQEPALRELFRELADGVALRAGRLMGTLNIEPGNERRYLLHALVAGLAVIGLATARPDGERRAATVLETALTLMSTGSTPQPRGDTSGTDCKSIGAAKKRTASRRARPLKPVLGS